jgi:hypothetical protein
MSQVGSRLTKYAWPRDVGYYKSSKAYSITSSRSRKESRTTVAIGDVSFSNQKMKSYAVTILVDGRWGLQGRRGGAGRNGGECGSVGQVGRRCTRQLR